MLISLLILPFFSSVVRLFSGQLAAEKMWGYRRRSSRLHRAYFFLLEALVFKLLFYLPDEQESTKCTYFSRIPTVFLFQQVKILFEFET